uniref:WAT1-related protein n=1 Tax=Phaseolus vulgaris TaxID=3885 RepID=V7BTT8_PHAVU|nr:hypothetical protein PHAVU_006G210200g [Phaseolus vulgaris]ESW20448.1 hypothetical protein PHAVU_006G210200g [Phaseolus vulgaris]
MRDIGKVVHGLKPALLMLMVQIAFASVNVLYKFALNDGMSVSVITAYRLMFAAASTVPLALIFERKNIPTLTWRVILKAFFCGLFGGSLFQNLYFESLKLISATFGSAVYNLIPAVTFILAVTCGFEKLNFQRASGKAKVLGTITGVGGAMMLTFLKGVEINIWTSHINLLHKKGTRGTQNDDSGSKVLGVFCGFGSCFCFALWLIVQGIVCSGIMVVVIAWCVRMRGPMYASVFNPLLLVLVAIAGSLMLDEKLYIGSVMGAVLIVMGLYMVLWGKSKEMKRVSHLETTPELEEIEVHDQSRCSNDKYTCSESNSVGKDDDNASKSEDEGQDKENNGKQDMGSSNGSVEGLKGRT